MKIGTPHTKTSTKVMLLGSGELGKEVDAVIVKKLEKDKCVVCGSFTEYDEFDHIDKRYFYVEGSGQLCRACYLSM